MRTPAPSDQREAGAEVEKTPDSDTITTRDRLPSQLPLQATLRRQRQAGHLHRLGPRPTYEALIEISHGHDIDAVLSAFGMISTAIVSALDGDRFPPPP